MKKTMLAGVALLALFGCSQAQLDSTQAKVDTDITKVQTAAATIDPSLTTACSDAMNLVPLASLAGPTGAAVAGYVTSGCADAEKITALAANPSSAEWVGTLVAQMKALIPVKAS